MKNTFYVSRLLTLLLILPACGSVQQEAVSIPGLDGKADDPFNEIAESAPTARCTLDLFSCPAEVQPIKVAFFDADSTLRVSKQGAVTATAVEDVDVLPFAARTIRELNKQGFLVAIVSNQGGVSSGKTPYEVAEGALATTARSLGRLGAVVHYFDFAEGYDEFRKPKIGMATKLEGLLQEKCGQGIDLTASQMVGDSGYKKDVDGPHPDGRPADDFSNADRFFAENLGVIFSEPTDAFGWREYGVFNILGEGELIVFLEELESHAQDLFNQGNTEEAARLQEEVEDNRLVNGL